MSSARTRLATLALAVPAVLAAATVARDAIEAAVLGIVEGLTEYLPVSSTGHLILTQRALGIPPSAEANAFAIVIQAGAIAAVLGLYRQRIASMARGLVGRDADGARIARAVGAAFLPAAVVGLLLDEAIEAHLFGLWPVTAAWFVGGVAILVVARVRPRVPGRGVPLESITARMAMLVGLAQCLALWPGTSRSLVTIVGGVLVGLRLSAAVEFSFLVGLITLGAATIYKAASSGPLLLESYGAGALAVGFVAATVSAMLSVHWLVGWVSRHGLALFGWYRVLLGLLVAAWLMYGVR